MILSTILRPFLALRAEDFPKIAAKRFGASADMDRTWQLFEPVARTLVDSFWTTVDDARFETLVPKLDATDPEFRGVAYEGAGMGLMLLDCLLPHKKRLRRFLAGPGQAYKSLIYIGAGLVLPRTPINPQRVVARYCDFDRWLILDGYGFYNGFFAPGRSLDQQARPRRITGYAARVFDQGLGRSLWFTTGANTERITATIDRFSRDRRPDLWSGVGLACAYAAGVLDGEAIRRLVTAAGLAAPNFAAGIAVASVFRQQAGHSAPHTDLACAVVWGKDSDAVARIAATARARSHLEHTAPPYEAWRQSMGSAWSAHSQPTIAARGVER